MSIYTVDILSHVTVYTLESTFSQTSIYTLDILSYITVHTLDILSHVISVDTLSYDTTDYINVRPKADE